MMPDIKPLLDAGLILVPIAPSPDGKGQKSPKQQGWNKPETYGKVIQFNKNFNYGLIHCASHTIALDLDDLEIASGILLDACGLDIKEMLNDPKNFQIKSPKQNRGKLIFKLPPGVELTTVKKHVVEKICIFELRGGPNQDVIWGRHPEGGEYEAIGDPNNIPLCPDVLLNMALNFDDWKLVLNPGSVEIAPGELTKYEHIHNKIDARQAFNDSHSIHDILVRNGYVFKGKGRYLHPNSSTGLAGTIIYPDGRLYSNSSDPLGTGHCHDAFSVYCILEHENDFKKAINWDPDITAQNKKAYFDSKKVVRMDDHKPSRAEMLEMGWKEALKLHVQEFNKTHALVMLSGNARVMRKTKAAANIYGRDSYEFLKPYELQFMYKRTSIKVDEKENERTGIIKEVFMNHFDAWHAHPDSDVYIGGVVFDPKNEAPDDYFNTWEGFGVEAKKSKDYPLLKLHIDGIICGHNTELIDYFWKWIAYTFQNPDKPASTALVLRGDKGIGKGIIGHFLRKLWGRHSMHVSSSEQVSGRFNGHLADVCFLFADEAFFSGDTKHESTLKALVTEPVLTIEKKGVDAIQVKNYLKMFMLTNKEFAVPASKDERRWAVYDVSDAMRGNKKYFRKLTDEASDIEVQQGFLYDMLKMELGEWTPANPPESHGLREQRIGSLSSLGRWLSDSLINGGFNNIGWHGYITKQELSASYLDWCSTRKIGPYEIASSRALGRYMVSIFGESDLVGEKRLTGYSLGTTEEAIAKFEDFEKVSL